MTEFRSRCSLVLWLGVAGCNGDDGGRSESSFTGANTLSSVGDAGTDNGNDDSTAGDDQPTGDGATEPTASADATATDTNDTATSSVDDSSDAADTGPPPVPSCQHQCATPQDCFIGGEETGLGCNSGVCSIACTNDPMCVAAASGWTLVACNATSDCSSGGAVCVDTGGGVGGCSLQPSQGPCSDAGLVEMPATTIEGNAVTVCGQPAAICTEFGALNVCIVDCAGSPCAGELSCETDGLCHCDFDTQCVDVGLGNNCNGQGLCEFACQVPTDCPAHPFDGGAVNCQIPS